MFWAIVCTLSALGLTYVVINRYFSFKLHHAAFPLTLTIVSLNMFLLLTTDVLLPWDVKQGTQSVSAPGNNSTVVARADNVTSLADNTGDAPMIRFLWLAMYWTQFLICWLVIPVLISYIELPYIAPRHDFRARLYKAMVANVKFYSLCLAGLVVGFVYLVLSTGHSPLDFKPLLISLAHLYSLSYTLILLATGLVILPKDLLHTLWITLKGLRHRSGASDTSATNNSLFVELSKTNEDLNDAQLSLSERAALIRNTQELANGDVLFNELLSEAKIDVNNKLESLSDRLTLDQNLLPLQASSINSLEKLNSNYNKFTTDYYNYIYYQMKSDGIIHTLAQSYNSNLYTVKGILRSLCGFVACVLSVVVLAIEILPRTRFNDVLFADDNSGGKGVYLSCLVIIFYNTICSLYAMSKFKFNNFHLIANGNSNPSNVLYYSLYSSRLLFPLCFNLMTLIPRDIIGESSFSKTLYHDLKLIPFVNYLNTFLPICFMTLVPISYKFDIRRKILLRVLGEEYYYQFFGMMVYEPVEDTQANNNIDNSGALGIPRTDGPSYNHINEDYEYSLQDGRYIYERASANFNFDNNSSLAPISLHDNVSTNSHLSTSTNGNNIGSTIS